MEKSEWGDLTSCLEKSFISPLTDVCGHHQSSDSYNLYMRWVWRNSTALVSHKISSSWSRRLCAECLLRTSWVFHGLWRLSAAANSVRNQNHTSLACYGHGYIRHSPRKWNGNCVVDNARCLGGKNMVKLKGSGSLSRKKFFSRNPNLWL